MRKSVNKAIEIVDAHIDFVSLVNKAANKREFLFAKDEEGKQGIRIQNAFIKADDGSHTVVGIVYEPGEEDAHGNFMKADEIAKAAEEFNETGEGIDIQHSEITIQEGVSIVKSWVTEEEQELYGEVIKAGTWLMQIDITDEDLWGKIEKGDITGFSMGGSGTYILEDVEPVVKEEEKAGLVKTLLKALGMEKDFIQKGEVMDRFKAQLKWDYWYNAKWALEDTLIKWDDQEWRCVFENDPAIIREALEEFSAIISTLLTTDGAIEGMIEMGVSKELQAEIEEREVQTIERIEKSKGDDDMKEAEVKEIVKSEVGAAVKAALIEAGLVKAADPEGTPAPEKTQAELVAEAVEKALDTAGVKKEDTTGEDDLEAMVSSAITKALEARGVSAQIDTENGDITKTGDLGEGVPSYLRHHMQ